MFSYFPNHSQNTPIGNLTLRQLHQQLVNPDQEPFVAAVNLIKQLRAVTDEEQQKLIKAKLPAFTPNASLSTKEKSATPEQKNIRYSGFMQIDIDLKENPNMTDAAEIRDKLAQIPYIALSALSARGKGVWALIALAEPEKFTQYINPVTEYFRMARITIDKSKSKNPTELRYFAPDPGAILKHDFQQFPLIIPNHNPKPKPSLKPFQSHQRTSTLSDLQQWVTETTGYSLVDGQKHYYIFWLSYALRKNGASETEVHNAIYTYVLSSDQIKSNCISGGIAHANTKGLYIPPQNTTTLNNFPPPTNHQVALSSHHAVVPSCSLAVVKSCSPEIAPSYSPEVVPSCHPAIVLSCSSPVAQSPLATSPLPAIIPPCSRAIVQSPLPPLSHHHINTLSNPHIPTSPNFHIIPIPKPPDVRHDYFGIDGLLHIHYPGIPD